jgi:hypothetical protein
MKRSSMVLLGIAGGTVGLLVGAAAVRGLFFLIEWGLTHHNASPVINFAPFLLVGAIMGAAGGATIIQKVLRQKSSLWKALLGSFVGLLVGWLLSLPVCFVLYYLIGSHLEGTVEFVAVGLSVCIPMVAGAVIGSGWKAKPVEPASC